VNGTFFSEWAILQPNEPKQTHEPKSSPVVITRNVPLTKHENETARDIADLYKDLIYDGCSRLGSRLSCVEITDCYWMKMASES
jgi:hypothetical protein